MDNRGFTTDPNRELTAESQWWDELDPAQSPSPYATAAWTYWHDFSVFTENIGNGQIAGVTFAAIRVYDTKASGIGEEIVFEEPDGVLLGELHYEIEGPVLTIKEWSHYNWRDDLPVRKAIEVLLNEAPDCVAVIQVKDAPNAFWVSEGFLSPFKGSEMLVHRSYYDIATAY
jgi:hypothetical protein